MPDADENQQYQENDEPEGQQSGENQQAEPEVLEPPNPNPSQSGSVRKKPASLHSTIDALKTKLSEEDGPTSSGSGSDTNQQEDRSPQRRSPLRGQFFRSWKKTSQDDSNEDWSPSPSNKWKGRAIMDPFAKRRARVKTVQPPPRTQSPPDRKIELPRVQSPRKRSSELRSTPREPSVPVSPRPKAEQIPLNPLRLSSADKKRAVVLLRPVTPPSSPPLTLHSARDRISRCESLTEERNEDNQEPVRLSRLRQLKGINQPQKPKKSTMDALNEIKRKREARRAQQAEEKRRVEKELREHGDDAGYKFRRLIQQYRGALPPSQQQRQTLQQLPLLSLSASIQPPPTPTALVDAAEAPRLSVFIRKRPLAKKELKKKGYDVISCLFASDDKSTENTALLRRELVCHEPKLRVDCSETLENHQFHFDGVFDEWQENSKVYNATVGPMIPYLVSEATASGDTTSLTVFAYGQTGSGKTFTMKSIYRQAADADLSARNVIHRSPEVFEEIVAKSTQILKKKVSTPSYNALGALSLQMGGGGSISSAQHSVSTQYSRGYAFYRLQQYAQAAEDFLECSRSDPDHAASALYNRGCTLYKLGRHVEAVKDLTKALKLNSKNPLFVESRARVLKEMGKFEEAILDYSWLDTLRHPTASPNDSNPTLLLESVCSSVQPTNSSAALAYEAQESSAKAWLEQFLKQTPGRTRSRADVAEAARLARCWGFFRGMRPAMIERCMRNATYYRFENDQIVVEQGKFSSSFHVVLDAVASLVKTVKFQGPSLRELNTLYQGDTIGLEPSSATNVDGRLAMLRNRAQRQQMLRPRMGSISSPLLASMRSLSGFQLNSLGSAARTVPSTLRPKELATFSCMGEVNSMLLDVDVYLNILREHEERVLGERLQFLHRCHAFGTCSEEMLAALAAVSGSKLVDPNKEALKTGEVVKQLYVIKKGVCHVVKKISVPNSLHRTSLPSRLMGSKSEDALTSRSSDGSWVLDNGWMLTNPRLVTNAQALVATKLQHSEEVTVAVLASGQLFGELSVLQPGQHSPVTVRTQTLVELLVFEEEDLSQLRVQYLSGTMNALQESLLFHNPPQQKLTQLRCDLTHWTREKRNVLEELFPPDSPVTKSPIKSPKTKKAPKTKKTALPATEPSVSSPVVHPRPLTSPTNRPARKKEENTRRSMIY
ncbi:hypothetical protein PC121_g5786 [Phytophthora cactorum]|nr:hypothetical protein PC121_g5786 [Phytophthora cactorum]